MPKEPRAILCLTGILLFFVTVRSFSTTTSSCEYIEESKAVDLRLGFDEMYLLKIRGSDELIVMSGFRDPVLVATRSHFVFWKLPSYGALQNTWSANGMENFGKPPKLPPNSSYVLRSVEASDDTFQDSFEVFGVSFAIYSDSNVALIEVNSEQVASTLKLENPPKFSNVSESDFVLTKP